MDGAGVSGNGFGLHGTAHRTGAETGGTPVLYSTLAHLWTLFSPPEEYVEEVATFRERLRRGGVNDGARILHLGSGGGSVDANLKRFYSVTGVELSQAMIDVATRVNPEVNYVQGDMRNCRLGRTFDAVLVHDAISYMTSIEELEMVYRTTAAHLTTGGILIALPEELRERLPHIVPDVSTLSEGNVVIHVIETHYDFDPADNVHESVFVFMIHDGDSLRVEVDRHRVGVFELDDFLGAIDRAGFEAAAEPWELSEWGDVPAMPLIVGVLR